MAEFMVVNPRRRHRRRKARARSKVNTRRRKRRVVRHHNPVRRLGRRRRRVGARHHRRRRVHRNPGIGRGGIGVLMTGAGIGAGAIATNLAAGWIAKKLPAQFQTGIAQTAVKAAVGLFALPMVLKFVPGGKKFIRPVMVGAGVAVALDIWNAYLAAPVMKSLGLADYHQGSLADYQTGQLAGDMSVGEQLQGTVYEGGVYD
jgi:hypothetical protein